MAEDTFIREVDEQIRQDRAQALWSKYGKLIIGAAVLIVVATAAITAWQSYQESTAAGFGDQYAEAIDLSNNGDHDGAMAALENLAAEGSGQYPALARMRIASEQAAKGDKEAALSGFQAIAEDTSFNEVFRDIARLRAGILAVDLQGYGEVEALLNGLAAAGEPFRHSAREALGIAALKAGDDQKAFEWFSAIDRDANAAGGVRTRVQLMLNLLAGRGVTADS